MQELYCSTAPQPRPIPHVQFVVNLDSNASSDNSSDHQPKVVANTNLSVRI